MSQSYAYIAKERDDLKSENETLRFLMDEVIRKSKEIEAKVKAEDENIRQNSITHETHKLLIKEERKKTAREILLPIRESYREVIRTGHITMLLDQIEELAKEYEVEV